MTRKKVSRLTVYIQKFQLMEVVVSRKESVIGLVKKMKGEDDKEIQLARDEFYTRFSPYIYKIAIQGANNFLEPDFIASEVVQRTFGNAFKYLSNFSLKDNLDETEATKIIKAWLGRIANKVFLNTIAEFSNEKSVNKLLEINDLTADSLMEKTNLAISNPFMDKLQAALDDLKEIDRLIVLAYAAEGCINSTRHISDNAMDFLCSTFNTTSANIRQRKKRALDKIKKKCFEEES